MRDLAVAHFTLHMLIGKDQPDFDAYETLLLLLGNAEVEYRDLADDDHDRSAEG